MDTSAKVVNFELSLRDYQAMLKHVCATRMSDRLLWLGGVFIASFGSAAFFSQDTPAFATGIYLGVMFMVVRALLLQRRLRPQPGGATLCRRDVQLTDGGVHVQTARWTSDVPWHGIVAVEETSAHCFLFLDRAQVYTIPKRAFASPEAAQQFVDFAHECASRARATKNTPA